MSTPAKVECRITGDCLELWSRPSPRANKRRWCWGVAACWRGGCTSCRAGFKREEEEERRHYGADPVLVTLRSLSRSWPAPCVSYHQLFLPSLFVCAVLWWRYSRWLCPDTEWVVERTHSSLLNLLQSQQLTTDGPYLIWKRRASTVSAVLSSSSRMETPAAILDLCPQE